MHQRPFLPHGAQYLLKGIHLSAFLSPTAGCPHAAQPYGAVFARARQPAPDSSPYGGKRPPHPFSVLSLRQKPCLRRKASHDLPIMSMPLSPPAQPAISGAWPSGHPCWRRHPDRCALNWFTAGEPSPSAGYPLFMGTPPFPSSSFPLCKGIFPQAPFSPKQD